MMELSFFFEKDKSFEAESFISGHLHLRIDGVVEEFLLTSQNYEELKEFFDFHKTYSHYFEANVLSTRDVEPSKPLRFAVFTKDHYYLAVEHDLYIDRTVGLSSNHETLPKLLRNLLNFGIDKSDLYFSITEDK